MLIILLSITVMFDALFVLLTQPSTLLAIVTEALQRSQRSADTLRGTARTRERDGRDGVPCTKGDQGVAGPPVP